MGCGNWGKTRVFTDHNEMVFSACFSPDGKYVLSGSRANTLLWNVTTGQFKKIYAGWSAICFSHDGKYILSAENKGNLLLWKVSGEKDILEPYVKEFNLTAKLLKGKTVKKPLSNQKIHLKNQSNTTVQTQTTDEYGDFEFKNVDKSQQYTFELEQNPELKNEKVYLARQDGIVVGEFMAGTKGVFRFELLPAIIEKLELKKEEDVFVQLDDFVSSDKNEIVIVDDIYYETGKWDVLPQAAEKLNRVVASLKKNPQMRIELLAHTDSRDEAQANLVLSQKRAKSAVDYIVSKGIDIKRVSGKGYGETKILNHCTDGVNCSEKEHALNRRTEFKFFKS
ncbi:MAG: hypothetical protein COA57_11400 [Flavobacteriales bacterium]|nr:MAG: hypothetical protein COA57_11400 [Flavobacteriales bacterium]